MFDCIAGTSVGGFIALGSAGTFDGKNPISDHTNLTNFFLVDGLQIFNTSKIKGLFNLIFDSSKHNPKEIDNFNSKLY